jgi:hypothetical protein
MLRCEACGHRLTGDTGYYRHRDVCDAFLGAVPANAQATSAGVPKELYEGVVEKLLTKAAVKASVVADVVAELADDRTVTDTVALARIERERDLALTRYRRDRDAVALDRAMADLDAREAQARVSALAMTPGEVVEYLGDLSRLWHDAPDDGRSILAVDLFDSVTALGVERMTFTPSAHALAFGLADALPSTGHIRVGYCRGERDSPSVTHVPARPRFVLVHRTRTAPGARLAMARSA